jgi:hypothetical protein
VHSIDLEWCEYAHRLNEKAAARLEMDECERYLTCISKALHDSPEQRRKNKHIEVMLSPCGWKIAITRDWEEVVELKYAASTIKYLYFVLCLCEKDINAALEYLLLYPIDESVLELSPEISVDDSNGS